MQEFYQTLSPCFAMGGVWCVRLTYIVAEIDWLKTFLWGFFLLVEFWIICSKPLVGEIKMSWNKSWYCKILLVYKPEESVHGYVS